jgi:hypothetical protein
MTQLPSLEFKYRKDKNESNTNTNTNTINNNIFVGKDTSMNSSQQELPASQEPPWASSTKITRSETPTNIKLFKEALLEILIGYFKSNVMLINNLVELSDNIIMKKDDLTYLISLLLEVDKSAIEILVQELSVQCCGKICSKLPRYRKIDDIIVNNKQSFQVSSNQYFIQMRTEFNISLDYIML